MRARAQTTALLAKNKQSTKSDLTFLALLVSPRCLPLLLSMLVAIANPICRTTYRSFIESMRRLQSKNKILKCE